ncbi:MULTISPECIES: peptidase inhibitor family I36 protein [unclassified Streptomyces]|uniref:peptidase inhibitor family I36 protein n=1 Tax=unclassified Streptomyces TaxID=2593676 RepID=UPI00367A5537
MLLKRKVGALAVAAAAAAGLFVSTSGTASAGTAVANSGNSGAYVAGVTGHAATGDGNDCTYGNLCLYTGTDWTGTRFDLYTCKTYSLVGWNGNGSLWNAQTTGQQAWLEDVNHKVVTTVSGRDSTIYGFSSYNFSPIWYAKNC